MKVETQKINVKSKKKKKKKYMLVIILCNEINMNITIIFFPSLKNSYFLNLFGTVSKIC